MKFLSKHLDVLFVTATVFSVAVLLLYAPNITEWVVRGSIMLVGVCQGVAILLDKNLIKFYREYVRKLTEDRPQLKDITDSVESYKVVRDSEVQIYKEVLHTTESNLEQYRRLVGSHGDKLSADEILNLIFESTSHWQQFDKIEADGKEYRTKILKDALDSGKITPAVLALTGTELFPLYRIVKPAPCSNTTSS